MSKKADKIVGTRRMAPSGSKAGAKSTNHKTGTGKPAGGYKTAGAKPEVTNHRHKPSGPVANLLAVRITAGVLAALCLAGGIALVVMNSASLSTNTIIELVLLGLITAAGVYAAVQPAAVAGWFAKLSR